MIIISFLKIPIPEANSPLEGELFDITKCFPEIFLLPKKQWVESLGDAQEDLHNMFTQILNFEGTIQSYIDMNPENILKLKKIEDLLLRFRMYLNSVCDLTLTVICIIIYKRFNHQISA